MGDSVIREMMYRLWRRLTKRRPKRLLLQYAVGSSYEAMLNCTQEFHLKYCRYHDADFDASDKELPVGRAPHWRKVTLLKQALEKGYDQVIWMDSDCFVINPTVSIFDVVGVGIGACECYDSPTIERHLNTGLVICNNSPEVMAFLREWEVFPVLPIHHWHDQTGFIDLMKQKKYRDLLTISSNRFNCTEVHMDSVDPVVISMHGDADRQKKMASLVNQHTDDPRWRGIYS